MSTATQNIMKVFADKFSLEEIEEMLAIKKKFVKKPSVVTERKKWLDFYENELLTKGVLYPPIIK